MTGDVLRWMPPPPITARVIPPENWAETVKTLRKEPGEWALVREYPFGPDRPESKAKAKARAAKQVAVLKRIKDETGQVQATMRTEGDPEPVAGVREGAVRIYARWLPKENG